MSRRAPEPDPSRRPRSLPETPRPDRGSQDLIIFGRRTVREALESSDVDVEWVRVSREVPSEVRSALNDCCTKSDVSFEVLDRRAIEQLSQQHRHDQGAVARVRLKRITDVDALIESSTGRSAAKPTFLLALDHVTNPQNVGMIVRSVVAAGWSGILWPTSGTPWINGLVIKASASTIFRCPIVRCDSLEQGLWTLKGVGFTVFGLDASGEESLFELAPPHRAVFIVGSEAEGISKPILELLDTRVSIPMAADVESLNVAVAASLVCFALSRPTT